MEELIDLSGVIIEDVEDDNACFWRSIATTLHYNFKGKNLEELLEKVDQNGVDKNEVYPKEEWGYYCKNVKETAREIQKRCLEYIIENKDEKIDESELTIEEMIPLYHDCDFYEYIERYQIFSGEEDEMIDNRWGSILECKIISIIFNVNIQIYNSQKIIKDKITNGKILLDVLNKNKHHRLMKPERGVYLKKTAYISAKEYTENTLNILWRKSYGMGHYMAIYGI